MDILSMSKRMLVRTIFVGLFAAAVVIAIGPSSASAGHPMITYRNGRAYYHRHGVYPRRYYPRAYRYYAAGPQFGYGFHNYGGALCYGYPYYGYPRYGHRTRFFVSFSFSSGPGAYYFNPYCSGY